MIYVTGDTHGDFFRFSQEEFPEQKDMTEDDFVIVCGDFGIWNNTTEERDKFEFLLSLPFTILFVDGNHENFDRLYGDEFPLVSFHGGKAHKIQRNVYHLCRGYVFTLENKKFFTFGGAQSHDIRDGILDPADFPYREKFLDEYYNWYVTGKQFRVLGQSWWPQELPSDEEMEFGLKTLRENDNKVDYIITHCCPQELASYFSRGMYEPDILTKYFDTINKTVNFGHWYFGHYHNSERFFDRYTMLYYDMERIL